MKKKHQIWILTFLLMTVASILPYFSMAQVTDPGCPDCPIDGGLSLLLAAGVGYGVKKYQDGRKKGVENGQVSG